MRLIAAITEPSVARRILECLSLPPRAPPLAPANEIAPELVECDHAFELSQTDAYAQSNPGFEFDPTRFDDCDPDDES